MRGITGKFFSILMVGVMLISSPMMSYAAEDMTEHDGSVVFESMLSESADPAVLSEDDSPEIEVTAQETSDAKPDESIPSDPGPDEQIPSTGQTDSIGNDDTTSQEVTDTDIMDADPDVTDEPAVSDDAAEPMLTDEADLHIPDTDDSAMYDDDTEVCMSEDDADQVSYTFTEMPDSEELLDGYMQSLIDEALSDSEGADGTESSETDADPDADTEPAADIVENVGAARYDSIDLRSVNRRIYKQLKAVIGSVASGRADCTMIRIPVNRSGISKTRFTPKDLGMTQNAFVYKDADGILHFTEAAKRAAKIKVMQELALIPVAGVSTTEERAEYAANAKRIIYALMADMPYDMYWFGGDYSFYITPVYSGSTAYISMESTNIYVCLEADTIYRRHAPSADEIELAIRLGIIDDESDRYVDRYLTDTSVTRSAAQTLSTAKAIVAEAGEQCMYDYDRLVYYRDRILQYAPVPDKYNTTYYSDGQYAQLINVFTKKKVSSAGYARAFKLLCDLSRFRYPYFDCYTMSGQRNGKYYMWNMVFMDDGDSYMVDIPGDGDPDASIFMRRCDKVLTNPDTGAVSYRYDYQRAGDDTVYSSTFTYGEFSGMMFSEEERDVSEKESGQDPGYDNNMLYIGSDLYATIARNTLRYMYTGKAIKPAVSIRNINSPSGNDLREGTDYVVRYYDNVKAGRARIKVTGKGAYTSSAVLYFDILPQSMAVENETVYTDPVISLIYNGTTQTPRPVVIWSGRVLKRDTDYTIEYYERREVPGAPGTYTTGARLSGVRAEGTYILRITGKGNFDPNTYRDVELNVTVNPNPRGVNSLTISKVKDQKYAEGPDGRPQPIEPTVTVKDGKKVLIPFSEDDPEAPWDYRVSYKNNRAVGIGYVFIEGNGTTYTGNRSIPFNIKGKPISGARITGLPKSIPYTGSPVTFDDDIAADRIVVSMNGVKLRIYDPETQIGDMEISYKSNVRNGTATMILTGRGGYTGTKKCTFKISPSQIKQNAITVEADRYTVYRKNGAKPVVTVTDTRIIDPRTHAPRILVENTDYTLIYRKNQQISVSGTMTNVVVKGKGNYTGTSYPVYYYVSPSDLSDPLNAISVYAPDIVVKKAKAGNYKSAVTVSEIDGGRLAVGKDVKIRYFRINDEQMSTLDSVRVEELPELTGKASVTAGEHVGVMVFAVEKTNAKYTGRTGNAAGGGLGTADGLFIYDVLSASNDISKTGVFKIAQRDYTGNPVLLSASDFIDARLSKKSPSDPQLRLGVPDMYGNIPEDCDFIIIRTTNNVKKGKAKVTLRGVNGYSGTRTVSFKIGAKRFFFW